MKKLLTCFILILISVSAGTIVSGQEIIPMDSILTLLQELKDDSKVKSMIASVRKGEDEILTIALGESMTSVPADVNMHFRTGGITETFFGTLLMILSDKGIIDIDEKISKWLPDLLAADKVTSRMLIKNTAGYKDYVLD